MFWKLQTNFFNAETDEKKTRLSNNHEIILQVQKGYRRQARSNPTIMVYQIPCTLASMEYRYW